MLSKGTGRLRYGLTPLRDTTSSVRAWLSSWMSISVSPLAR